MAALARGGPASPSKPRTSGQGAKSRKPKSGGYTPAKLNAARKGGLPPHVAALIAAGVVCLGLLIALLSGNHLRGVGVGVGTGLDRQFAAVGFKVKTLTVQGASPMARDDIIKAVGVYRDEPILGLDLNTLRARVEQVGWVKQARVVRLLPDAIVVVVDQRDALAVWQHDGRVQVVDSKGDAIPEADPGRFSELPLVVGEGANEGAAAILPTVQLHPRLMQRLEALVRVDGRRWDLRMKDGGLIQLPAVGEDSALIQLDQLDQKSRILELGFARIDLRDPELVAVRPRDAAPPGQPAAGGA
ncbi:MAG TPA: cell division protein FtsQ/DivIB [Caulobacteraceae bacterium]|jgi:cell division protein FtsQ|nr:cell division protein FtsQ/DivIB [Caulobacteraceae bacterium]